MQRDAARRLLGVVPGASAAEVERAFRRRARRVHPDHGGDPAAFRELLVARAVLTASEHVGAEFRSRLIVRRSPARRLLRALRARLPPHRPAPRVH